MSPASKSALRSTRDKSRGRNGSSANDSRDSQEDTETGRQVTLRFRYQEDVRALLPFGSAVTVRSPPDAKELLRDLVRELADHYALTSAS